VIFAAVADGERGGSLGARFLVDEHPELVHAEWAIGEGGGTTIEMDGRRFYPILVAHKGFARISMKASRPEGQGAVPFPDSAPLRLARALARIGNMPLPIHVTEPARRMLHAIGAAGGLGGLTAAMLARRPLADFALQSMIADPSLQLALSAVLRNTATPAELSAAASPGTVPATAEAILDGRLLPGQSASALLSELREVIDDADITLTVLEERPAIDSPIGSPLYERLAAAVKELDPRGIPVPFLMPGSTDASAFCRLGMRFYGFAPVRLPEGSSAPFGELAHGVEERIPTEGWKAGLRALHAAVVGFCST
jgi:acetylornithine deacetylase/succinyl-diaminopimelate desuccinylase-like protein